MEKQHYRSLFWPVILIGVGLIWLLGSMGIIPNANFARLLSLWPLVLIVIGLDILIGRRSPVGGAVMGLVAVALIAFFLLAGPALGLPTAGILKTETISSEISDATTANINLSLASQPASIYALDDRTSLLKGEVDYYGTLNYTESGTTNRRIRLHQVGTGGINIPWDPNARWKIGLTPNLPIELTVDGASGSADLDLSQLRLTGLSIDQGSGSLDLQLPSSTQAYNADLNGASGSMEVTFAADSDVTVRLNGGSGSIKLSVPTGSAVQLQIRSSGSGSVNLPSWLQEVKVYSNGKEGTWQTAGFDQAQHQIFIIGDDLGSGSFAIN